MNTTTLIAKTEIAELILEGKQVESAEIWVLLHGIMKIKFIKTGLMIEDRLLQGALRLEFQKRMDEAASHFNPIYEVTQKDYKDLIKIQEMNYMHLVLEIKQSSYFKKLEIFFKIKNDRITIQTDKELYCKQYLTDCLNENNYKLFFDILSNHWPFFEFLDNLQNNFITSWVLNNKIENKKLVYVIGTSLQEYSIVLHCKNFMKESTSYKPSIHPIKRVDIKLHLSSPQLAILFDKNQQYFFDIFFNLNEEYYNGRLRMAKEGLIMEFIDSNEILFFFESFLSFILSFNQIIQLYNFLRYKKKKEKDEPFHLRMNEPEFKLMLEDERIVNISVLCDFFNMYIHQKPNSKIYEPKVIIRQTFHDNNLGAMAYLKDAEFNIYREPAVFYSALIEMKPDTERRKIVEMIFKTYSEYIEENKTISKLKFNLFSIFGLLYEDLGITFFSMDIIIYDEINYVKAKLIYPGNEWKLVIENLSQTEYKTIDSFVEKILNISVKDLRIQTALD